MIYFMPERTGVASLLVDSANPFDLNDNVFANYYPSRTLDLYHPNIGLNDFTYEIVFRVTSASSPAGYTTVLAIDRSNLNGDVFDIQFTDNGFGWYLALTMRRGTSQGDTLNHSNTFCIPITYTDALKERHIAFVRTSGILTAYVDGSPVGIRIGPSGTFELARSFTYNINMVRMMDSRASTNGNTTRIWTITRLISIDKKARYQEAFTPQLDTSPRQDPALVFM